MRWVLLAFCAALALAAGDGPARAGEARDARLRAAVAEFTSAGTPASRREQIARDLAAEPDAAASPSVLRALREGLLAEPRREAALELAVALRASGTFAVARRFCDGPLGARVVDLALAGGAEDALAWVLARWSGADTASAAFRAADEGLRRHVVPPAAVDAVAKLLGDPGRGAAALAVLRFQMGIDDETPGALLARWAGARRAFEHEGRAFPPEGTDLLRAGGWSLRGARAVAANLRIPAGALVDLPRLPDSLRLDDCIQRNDGALRLRVAAAAGAGLYVALLTEGGAQELRLRSDGATWFLVEGPPRDGERVEAPFAAGEWTDITVRVRDPHVRGRPGLRDLRVLVAGRELRPSGGFWRLDAPPASLSVRAGDDSPAMLGGVEWVACDAPAGR